MARNRHPGTCYVCGRRVEADTGHFERHNGGWRVKHANVGGFGRVTCEEARRNEIEASKGIASESSWALLAGRGE